MSSILDKFPGYNIDNISDYIAIVNVSTTAFKSALTGLPKFIIFHLVIALSSRIIFALLHISFLPLI
jgi:hypothetical protein